MSARAESGSETPESSDPRRTSVLYGHADAEAAFLDAYRSRRMPHAWLIGGPAGIGKATLAYRIARFVLAHRDPSSDAVQAARTLAISDDHAVTRRVAAQGHGNLLVLERVADEKTGRLKTVIAVEQVRGLLDFFGQTAAEEGWRICIIDAVDELNAAGANALLKILEEPPPRALLLLVSHAPGRLLPTIRSRCRRLTLRPLSTADVVAAAATALDRAPEDPELAAAAAAADGSVAHAIMLLGGSALAVRARVNALLAMLPAVDPRALHALGDALGRSDDVTFTAFVDTVREWLSARLQDFGARPRRLAKVAEVWDKLNRSAREVEVFHLERKPMVFTVFGLLAEAARS